MTYARKMANKAADSEFYDFVSCANAIETVIRLVIDRCAREADEYGSQTVAAAIRRLATEPQP